MNYPTMTTLSATLKPSVKKKKAPPGQARMQRSSTQGKVVPVNRKPKSPYKPIQANPNATGLGTANQQGVNKQQAAIESRAPVSTQLNVSYESDPVLARIKALGTQDVANARAEADALRKKAIIDSGLGDVGAEIGLDQGTLQAAAANPFSTSATIQREQAARGRDLDESLNQQNLFYGGHRANQLTDLATSGAQQQAALQGDIRSLLGGINSGVTQVEQQTALREQEALEAQAEQQRQAALQQSYLDALYAPDVAEPPIADLLGGGEGYIPYAGPQYEGLPFQAMTPEEEIAMQLGLFSYGHQAY